jgi:hypothetical protein
MDFTIQTTSSVFKTTVKNAHDEIKSRLRWYHNELKKRHPGDEFPDRSIGLIYANWYSAVTAIDFCLSDGIIPITDIARIDNQTLFDVAASFSAKFLVTFCEEHGHDAYVFYLTISQQLFGQDQGYVDYWSRNFSSRESPFTVVSECFKNFNVNLGDLPHMMDLATIVSQHTRTVFEFLSSPNWTEEALESIYT